MNEYTMSHSTQTLMKEGRKDRASAYNQRWNFNIRQEQLNLFCDHSCQTTGCAAHWELKKHTPDTDTESSLPTVGVVAALMELVEEMEEVLSARANGAMGGGLAECTGGLNGRLWKDKKEKGRL